MTHEDILRIAKAASQGHTVPVGSYGDPNLPKFEGPLFDSPFKRDIPEQDPVDPNASLRDKLNSIMGGSPQLFGRQGIQPGGDRFASTQPQTAGQQGFNLAAARIAWDNFFNGLGLVTDEQKGQYLQAHPEVNASYQRALQLKAQMAPQGEFNGQQYYGSQYNTDPNALLRSQDWSQYGAAAQTAEQARFLGEQQYAAQAAEYQKGMSPSQLASQQAGIYNTPQGDTSQGYTKSKDGTTVPTAEYGKGYAAGVQLVPKVKSINVQGMPQVNNQVNRIPPPQNATQGYQKGWMDAMASNSKKREITAGRIPYDLLVDLRTLLEPYFALWEHGVAGRGWRKAEKEAIDLVKRMAPGVRNPDAFVHAFVRGNMVNPDYEDTEISPEVMAEWENHRKSPDFKERRPLHEYTNERATYEAFPEHSAEQTDEIWRGFEPWILENWEEYDSPVYGMPHPSEGTLTRDEIMARHKEQDRIDYERYLKSLKQAKSKKREITAGDRERRLREIIEDRKRAETSEPREQEPEFETILQILRKHRPIDPHSKRRLPAKDLGEAADKYSALNGALYRKYYAQELPPEQQQNLDPDLQSPELDEEIPEEMDDPKDLLDRISSLIDAMEGEPDPEISEITLKLIARLEKAIQDPFSEPEAEARELDN